MADDFATPLKTDEPNNYLNYSRGYEDRSGSTLFRGLGDSLSNGIAAVDRGKTQMVQDEVRAAVENADAALGINSNPRTQGPALPDEVVSKIERLRINKEAMLAGRLNPEHYYARLHTESKKIRSRWGGRDGASGYTEQIDNAFKELIGTTPANALRRELQSQAEAASAAAQSGKDDNQRLIDGLITSGKVPPKFLSSIADPSFSSDPQRMMALKAEVANNQAFFEMAERDAQMINLRKARGEETKAESAELYGRKAFKILNDSLESGTDYQRLQAMITKARGDREAGKTMNGEELGQITNLFGKFKQQLTSNLAKLKIQSGVDAGPESDKYDQQINTIINNIEEGLTKGKVGLLEQSLSDAKVLGDTAKAELLGYSEVIRRGTALRETMGEVAFGNFLQSEAGENYETEIANFTKRGIAIDAASGHVRSFQEAVNNYKQTINSDPAAAKEFAKVITGSTNAVINGIFDDKVDSNTRLNLYNSLYGPDNQRLWMTLGADRKRQMMLKLLSPTAFTKVKQLGQVTGDGNVMDNYLRTLANLSAEVAKPHVDTLNEIGLSVSNKRVDYDPNSNRIRVVDVEAPEIDPNAPLPTRLVTQAAQYFLNSVNATGFATAQEDVNSMLSAFETTWKERGMSKEEMNMEAIRLLNGIGLKTGSAGRNILERLRGAERNNVPQSGRMNLSQEVRVPGSTRENVSAEQGTDQELRETIRLFNESNDPAEQADLKRQIFELMSLDPELMNRTPPVRNPQNVPTSQEEDVIIMAPPSQLGGPINPAAVASSPVSKEVIDLLTGAPSFIEAIKSGDPATIAAAAAGIIPFPGAKVKKGKKLLDQAADIIDNKTLETTRDLKISDAFKNDPDIKKMIALDPDKFKKAIENVEQMASLRTEAKQSIREMAKELPNGPRKEKFISAISRVDNIRDKESLDKLLNEFKGAFEDIKDLGNK